MPVPWIWPESRQRNNDPSFRPPAVSSVVVVIAVVIVIVMMVMVVAHTEATMVIVGRRGACNAQYPHYNKRYDQLSQHDASSPLLQYTLLVTRGVTCKNLQYRACQNGVW